MKPVPRPRSKTQLKALSSTNSNILESAEEANSTSNAPVSFLPYLTKSESRHSALIAMIVLFLQVSHYYECPADSTRPKPLRPPPKSPSLASTKSAVFHLNSNTATTLEVNDNLKAELRTSVPCMPSSTDGQVANYEQGALFKHLHHISAVTLMQSLLHNVRVYQKTDNQKSKPKPPQLFPICFLVSLLVSSRQLN